MDDFYVYAYLDPRKLGPFAYSKFKFEYEPFYIGKGRNGRCNSHLKRAQSRPDCNYHNPHLTRKIKSMLREGFEPIIVLRRKHITEEQAFRSEASLILAIGRWNEGEGPLTNLTDGGDGIIGRKVTRAHKKAYSEGTKRQMAQMTPEEKEARSKKISEGLKRAYAEGKRDAAAQGKKISRTKRRRPDWWETASEEEKAKRSKLQSKVAKAVIRARKLDPEKDRLYKEKVGMNSKRMHANMTKRKKKDIAEKISNKITQIWESRTVTERKKIARKVSRTLLGRD